MHVPAYIPELDRAALQQAITVLRYELALTDDPTQQRKIERDLRSLLKQWIALAAPQDQPLPAHTQRYRRSQPSPDALVN
jgi:hypothetical protein